MAPGQLTFSFGLESICTDLEEASTLLTKANRRSERQEALTMRHVPAISPTQVSMHFEFLLFRQEGRGSQATDIPAHAFPTDLAAHTNPAAVNGAVRSPTELPHWLKLEIAKA